MKCPRCDGTGWIQSTSIEGEESQCPDCRGSGIDFWDMVPQQENLPDESTVYGNDCRDGRCEM